VVDGAVCKLVLGPTVLGEWGKENVKLSLRKTDDFSSSFFSKLLKVELGSSIKGFECYNPPYFSPPLYPSASTPKPLAKPLPVLPPLPPSNPPKDAC